MNSTDVFTYLKLQGLEELERLKVEGKNDFSQGNYSNAEKIAYKAKEINSLLNKLDDCQKIWNTLITRDVSKTDNRKKVFLHNSRKGTVTSHQKFRLPLLKVLVEMGGSGQPIEVIKRIEELMISVLTENDVAYLHTRKEIRWQNAVRWERSHLVNEGLLKSGSPRGIWEITAEGRKYLDDQINRSEKQDPDQLL